MKRVKLKTNIPKRKKQITTLLVDSKYLAYRGRYSKGQGDLHFGEVKTNVYYSFFNSLKSVAKKFHPDKVFIIADIDSETSARRNLYPNYKVKRYTKELSDIEKKYNREFKEEYENLMRECQEIGMSVNFLLEYEADDLMAYYCKKNKTEKIIILSRDEDMYQCITENVICYNPDDKIQKDLKWFKATYDIDPAEWAMVKQIAGCSSDAVPGVKGIGEQKAIKYIKGICSENDLNKINEAKADIELYAKLVTLPHADLNKRDFTFQFKQCHVDEDKMISLFQKWGFRSFLENLSDFDYFK